MRHLVSAHGCRGWGWVLCNGERSCSCCWVVPVAQSFTPQVQSTCSDVAKPLLLPPSPSCCVARDFDPPLPHPRTPRSLGCTVIELITGSPPYFDLAPMTALFRIVQDESPPIPDRVSRVRSPSPGPQLFPLPCFIPIDSNITHPAGVNTILPPPLFPCTRWLVLHACLHVFLITCDVGMHVGVWMLGARCSTCVTS